MKEECCENCRFAQKNDEFPLDMFRCRWHSFKSKDKSVIVVNQNLYDGLPPSDVYVNGDFWCGKYKERKDKCISDEATIDDALRELIEDSDLEEVVSCLDMICKESNRHLMMFNGNGVEYPSLKHLFNKQK